jgi:hypothetical protein
LKQEVKIVKEERDGTSEDLFRTRARVRVLEKEKAELHKVHEQFVQYDEGMQHAFEEIESRDEMIGLLSSKLEQALDQLEQEKSQPQRRGLFRKTSP